MTPNPAIMKSVEQLGYRVTVGDVATQAGMEINLAQQGLLTLASDAGGHLQVSDTGEIVYLFPRNFRGILQNKYWKLRLKEWWEKVWKVLFYLIRISFGIVLILSIVLMMVAIVVIIVAISSTRDNDSSDNRSSSGGITFFPYFWFSDIFYIFTPGYGSNYYERQQRRSNLGQSSQKNMNFLEAVFSFLFGDGNPNLNLEERRWQEIGIVIRNNSGSVIAEQIAPYLDNINRSNQENEDYMIPVLARFNGYPKVSPEGEIIYYFPELQVTAKANSSELRQATSVKSNFQAVSAYLKERLWRFSEAESGQILLATGLGAANIILALVLGSFLRGGAAQLGGLVAFVSSIYWILLIYAVGFLAIPLIRYFWIQWCNSQIEQRNQQRQARAEYLNINQAELTHKLTYAHQFAAEKVITDADITYSTEKGVLEQEIEQSDKIDEEWRRRLESGS